MVSTCEPITAAVARADWMAERLALDMPVTPATWKSLRVGAVVPAAVLASPA